MRRSVASCLLLLACGTETTAASTCPDAPPFDGTPCTSAVECEYRASSSCVVRATCESTPTNPGLHWSNFRWPGCATNPVDCPASFGNVPVGTACSLPSTEVCAYSEGNCACEPCEVDGGTSSTWKCRAWSDVACGAPRPLLGTPCDHAGATCDYEQCCAAAPSLGPRMVCVDGVWSEQKIACKCIVPICP